MKHYHRHQKASFTHVILSKQNVTSTDIITPHIIYGHITHHLVHTHTHRIPSHLIPFPPFSPRSPHTHLSIYTCGFFLLISLMGFFQHLLSSSSHHPPQQLEPLQQKINKQSSRFTATTTPSTTTALSKETTMLSSNNQQQPNLSPTSAAAGSSSSSPTDQHHHHHHHFFHMHSTNERFRILEDGTHEHHLSGPAQNRLTSSINDFVDGLFHRESARSLRLWGGDRRMSPEELQEERDAIDASLNRTTTPETCLAQKWGVTQEVIGKGAFGKIRIIRRDVQQQQPSSSSSSAGDGEQQLFAVKVEKYMTESKSNMVNVMCIYIKGISTQRI